jgi:hypothetical protein
MLGTINSWYFAASLTTAPSCHHDGDVNVMTATLTWTTSCHVQILLPNKLFAFLYFSLRHSLRHSAWAGLDLHIKTRRKEGKKKTKTTQRSSQTSTSFTLLLVRDVSENLTTSHRCHGTGQRQQMCLRRERGRCRPPPPQRTLSSERAWSPNFKVQQAVMDDNFEEKRRFRAERCTHCDAKERTTRTTPKKQLNDIVTNKY